MFAWGLILCVHLATGATGAARAQSGPKEPGELSAADKRRARDLFNRGELNYRLQAFKKALVDYRAALKIRHHPNVIFNIAQCYHQLKQPDKALFFYKLFLADWSRLKPGTQPPNHAEVLGHIARLEAEIRAREEQRRRDELDSQRRELANQRSAMLANQRTAMLEASARERARRQSRRKTRPPQEGMLNLEGLDVIMARVLVDGRELAKTPISKPIAVKPGKVEIRIVAEGYLPWTRQVAVSPGGAATVRVDLRRPEIRRSRLWLTSTIASLVLAAGAEALAVVFTLRANEHFSDSETFAADRSVAIAGHAAAGGLAAWGVTSLVFYLRSGRVQRSPASPKKAGAPAAATVAPIPGGVMALGQWRF